VVRIQKKMLGEINPENPLKGWDPLGDAMRCISSMKFGVERCDPESIIAGAGCAYGNAEAAFYEKQASEDEMISIKKDVAKFRSEFTKKCKCSAE
jgi:hypothetical protein